MIEKLSGMKVLSVTMPWAWFIMRFGKDIENRTWRTNYRGRILIHSSKKPSPYTTEIIADILGEDDKENWKEIYKLCGCIIGSVEMVDCVRNYISPWAERDIDMWHWVLKNPVLLEEPIPARGRLGLWEYKEELK